ncbi:hypothetical protein [Gracilimonas sp.]|uniref:hypothetical protein n=1 Tax=Gracilimonas sp. TaxID=1974203 RepID=UPI0032ED3A53
MKRLLPILLFSISAGLLLSTCSTGPDFERDNKNDPESNEFLPDTPSGANFSFSVDTIITISWEDQTQFETGYRIHKKIGEVYNKLLTTLSPNAEQFADSTKEFGFPTTYLVTAEKNSSTSDSLTIEIDFGNIEDLNSSLKIRTNNQSEINLEWIDNIYFEDGFFLMKVLNQGSAEKTLKVLDANLEKTSIPLPNDSFIHEFKIVPFKIFKNDTTILALENSTTFSLAPKNLDMKLISEDSLLFTWDFDADFHDEFLLELETEVETKEFKVNKNKTELKINLDVNRDFEYKANLSASIGNLNSPKVSTSRRFELPSIRIDSIGHVSESEILIRTSNPSSTHLVKHVYRSTGLSNNFSKVGEIPKGENEFYDTNLNKNNIYTYYISTKLSDESSQISVSNRKGLRVLKSFTLEKQVKFLSQNRINKKNLSHSFLASDFNSRELLQIDYLTNEQVPVFDYDFYAIEFALHSDQNIIATLRGTETEIGLHLFNNNKSILIDSVSSGSSTIRNIDFVDDRIFYLIRRENYHWRLMASSLNGVQKDTLLVFTSENEDPSFVVSRDKSELYLIKNTSYNEFQLSNYSVSESRSRLQETTTINTYPIDFSPTLDSLIISRAQYNVTVIDVNTNKSLFSEEFSFYNSNSLGQSFFFGDGLLYVPDQASAYIIDSRNTSDPILQTIGFKCCSISFAGAFWNYKTQHLIDMRRSHTSGIPDFYTVYKLESFWRILEE